MVSVVRLAIGNRGAALSDARSAAVKLESASAVLANILIGNVSCTIGYVLRDAYAVIDVVALVADAASCLRAVKRLTISDNNFCASSIFKCVACVASRALVLVGNVS